MDTENNQPRIERVASYAAVREEEITPRDMRISGAKEESHRTQLKRSEVANFVHTNDTSPSVHVIVRYSDIKGSMREPRGSP